MNHASDPARYPCCHPLPPWGRPDASCRSVGDDCEEGEENCVCGLDDGEEEDHKYTLEDPEMGGDAQGNQSSAVDPKKDSGDQGAQPPAEDANNEGDARDDEPSVEDS